MGEMQRELHCLLALPAGVGPEVLDIAWDGRSLLEACLSEAPGEDLGTAAGTTGPEHVPRIARAVCQALIHVHRAGWVHSDVKPENIQVFRRAPKAASGAAEISIRLLDFGFAFDRFSASGERPAGGTPPYWAPELQEGWIIDGRTDLYSLGVTLRRLHPGLVEDSRWQPILERLGQESPARRFPDAVALRDELEAVFGLEPAPDRFASVWSGPMQGRGDVLDQLRTRICAGPKARCLVHARPGTGLSRFLRETVLAVAAAGGPPLHLIDLSGVEEPAEWAGAMDLLGRLRRARGAILVGLSDPTPDCWWTPEPSRSVLLRAIGNDAWEKLFLAPLGAGSFCDAATSSTGSSDPRIASFAHSMARETDCDFKCAAGAFRELLQRRGHEVGLAWRIDDPPGEEATDPIVPARPPFPADLPGELKDALRICARAGFSFPESLCRESLEKSGQADLIPPLLERACLLAAGGRLQFVTRGLWREALADSPPDATAIDAWLNERQSPDADRIEETIFLSERARALGDRGGERRLLSSALARADRELRAPDILRLAAYPLEPPEQWTIPAVVASAAKLQEIVGPPWSADRILVSVAVALFMSGTKTGLELLHRAAQSPEAATAVRARFFLADRIAENVKDPGFDDHLEFLRAAEGTPAGMHPGTTEHLAARRRWVAGEYDRARELGRIALEKLRGSGEVLETITAQNLAFCLFFDAPTEAVSVVEDALLVARAPDHRAQLHRTLADLCLRLGLYNEAERWADLGLAEAGPAVSPARLLNLRSKRAAARADLDRIDSALEEARAILNLPATRLKAELRVDARALVAYCHLHRGRAQAAIRELVQACRDADDPAVGIKSTPVRKLVDALLDAESEHLLEDLVGFVEPLVPGVDTPDLQSTPARYHALRMQNAGDHDGAANLLLSRKCTLNLSHRSLLARYVHQLALLRLRQAKRSTPAAPELAREARSLFQEELATCPAVGQGYNRARALLGLARAEFACGNREDAALSISRAISTAESIEALGVVADCLKAKTEFQLI